MLTIDLYLPKDSKAAVGSGTGVVAVLVAT